MSNHVYLSNNIIQLTGRYTVYAMKEDEINFQQLYIFPLTYINYVTR